MVGTWDREDVRNIAICRRGRASLDRYVRVLNEDIDEGWVGPSLGVFRFRIQGASRVGSTSWASDYQARVTEILPSTSKLGHCGELLDILTEREMRKAVGTSPI